jgi:hypothetical protein
MSAAKVRHPRPRRAGNNSTFGEKVTEKIHSGFANTLGGRKVSTLLAIFFGLVIVVAGITWFYKYYSNPQNVFWDMVENNLSTSSITKEITQKSTNATSKEITRIILSPNHAAHDVKQIDASVSGSKSMIRIESIGTPTDTYQRYVLISQPAKAGKKKADFSKVYALWLKNGGNAQSGNSQLFNNAVFSGFLFGNLPPSQKSTALNYMRKAYKVDFNNIDKKSHNSRKTYVYTVSLAMQNYAKAARFYADALKLPNAKQISANNYHSTDKIEMSVTIDVLSRQLREVTYTTNSSTEKYSAYGITSDVSVPKKTVTYDTLQNAVNQAVAK